MDDDLTCGGEGYGSTKQRQVVRNQQVITEGWCKACQAWVPMVAFECWPDGIVHRFPPHVVATPATKGRADGR